MGSVAYALNGLFYEPITSLKLVIEGLRLFIEDLRLQNKAGIQGQNHDDGPGSRFGLLNVHFGRSHLNIGLHLMLS